jgi:hypothetical protein
LVSRNNICSLSFSKTELDLEDGVIEAHETFCGQERKLFVERYRGITQTKLCRRKVRAFSLLQKEIDDDFDCYAGRNYSSPVSFTLRHTKEVRKQRQVDD